jgi:hypothetical protein
MNNVQGVAFPRLVKKDDFGQKILSERPFRPSVRIYHVDAQLFADGFLRVRVDKNLFARILPIRTDPPLRPRGRLEIFIFIYFYYYFG